METHRSSCELNDRINGVLARMPWMRKIKDRFVLNVLEDIYVRSVVLVSSRLVEQGKIEAPRAVSFGHIHRADLVTEDQLQKRGINAKHMPKYVLNTGTGVPLLPKNNGVNKAHFARLDDNGTPSLWCSYDEKMPDKPPYQVQ